MSWAVYDLVLNGEIVYVGCTSRLDTRLAAHLARGVCKDVELQVIEWHDDASAALSAETARIRMLQPAYNIRDTDNDKATVEARIRADAIAADWRGCQAAAAKWKEIDDEYVAWAAMNPEANAALLVQFGVFR